VTGGAKQIIIGYVVISTLAPLLELEIARAPQLNEGVGGVSRLIVNDNIPACIPITVIPNPTAGGVDFIVRIAVRHMAVPHDNIISLFQFNSTIRLLR